MAEPTKSSTPAPAAAKTYGGDQPSSPAFRVLTDAEYRMREVVADEIRLAGPAQAAASGGGASSVPEVRSVSRSAAGRFPGPWHLALSGAGATLTECIYQRGPVVKLLGSGSTHELTHTIVSAGPDIWLGAKIDIDAGTAEIIEGDSLESVTDQEIPEDPQYIRKPLYRLLKTGAAAFSVAWDYRNIPEVVARV